MAAKIRMREIASIERDFSDVPNVFLKMVLTGITTFDAVRK